jgi:hypothetical protein
MNYRLDFFSRSGERDFCRCDELAMLRSFDLSRSRDDFWCLRFLFDGLRDRPIVLEYNTKSKQDIKELIDSLIKNRIFKKKRTKKRNNNHIAIFASTYKRQNTRIIKFYLPRSICIYSYLLYLLYHRRKNKSRVMIFF